MRLFNYFPYRNEHFDPELEKRIFRYSLFFPALFVLVCWLVKITEMVFDIRFTRFGVLPMQAEGLPGILFSPFIHSDLKHLGANTVPFFILSTALFYFYRKLAYRIFILLYLLAGVLLWLGGREAWHIGASGLVYGLASFLFFSGIFRNDVRLLTIGLIVAFLYGSLFWGIFPIKPEISWEGHLWGAVSGLVLSYYYRKQGPQRQILEWENELEEEEEFDYHEFEGEAESELQDEEENIKRGEHLD